MFASLKCASRPLRRQCLRSGLLLALLACGASQAWAQPAAGATWRMATEYPASAMPGEGLGTFADEVKARTAGAIEVKPSFDASAGVKSAQMPAAVKEGRLEGGDAFGGALGAVDPLFLLSSLPFTANDFDDAKALASCSQPAVEQHLSKLNAHLLYVTPWPPSGIWSATPLTDLAALKALRIRTYDENSRAVFEQVGAQSVNLPFSAVPPKLAAGELNAVLSSGDGGAGNRLWEQLGNFSAVSYSIPLSYTVINQDVWQRLKPEQQAILTEAAKRTAASSWSNVKDRIASNYARMREHKMTLNLAPAQEIQDSLRSAARSQVAAWQQKANATDIVGLCLTGTSQASQVSK